MTLTIVLVYRVHVPALPALSRPRFASCPRTNVHRKFPALLFQSNECPKLNLPLRMARVSDAFHEPDAHHQTQTHQRLVYSFRIADKLQYPPLNTLSSHL